MYIIEGNMGAGKSTFLKKVREAVPNIAIHLEPVDNWQDEVHGQSLLKHFYEDTKRWAYTFETWTLMNRVYDYMKLQEKMGDNTVIVERSIYSGYYCFALNTYENGFMTEAEWGLYQKWFAFLLRGTPAPHGFIYLHTHPDVAHDRIKQRNRTAESSVPFEYVEQIHSRHHDFLIKKDSILESLKEIPVLVLDCNEDFEQNENQFKKHIDQLKSFMAAHPPFFSESVDSRTGAHYG